MRRSGGYRSGMAMEMTISLGSEQYVLRHERDAVQVGRQVGDDVTWLETVDASLLPGPALEALERGDAADEALLNSLRGVLQAEVERGG
jgi:hypothetical protein